jgi:hypothetical protein
MEEGNKMNDVLLDGFMKSDIKTVIEGLKNNGDKQTVFKYVETINSWKLTMMQCWILEEMQHTKNHGFGIWELC